MGKTAINYAGNEIVKPLKLKTTVAATVAFMVLGIAIVRGSFIASTAEIILGREIGHSMGETAQHVARQLDADMQARAAQMAALASVDLLASLPAAQKLVDEMKRRDPTLAWIGVIDASGKVLVGSNGVLVDADVSERPAFQEGVKDLFIGDVHEAVILAAKLPNPTGEPMRFVDVAAPIKGENGLSIGVLAAHYSWSWAQRTVRELTASIHDGDGLEALVVGADGVTLLGPDDLIGSHYPTQDLLRTNGLNYAIAAAPNGQLFLAGFAVAGGHGGMPFGWTVITRRPVDVALMAASHLRMQVIGSGVLLAFLFSGLGWLVAGWIARPLNKIAMVADRLRAGERGVVFPKNEGVAEARSLALSLDSLVAVLDKRAADLAESDARFRALAEAMPAILFVTDSTGGNTYTNPQFTEFSGLSAEELLGYGWLPVLHPDDRARTAKAWAKAVASGNLYQIEYRFRRRDGAWRWFLGRGVPQRDAEGEIVRWLGICTDIHELRSAEEALRESEERLRLGAQIAGFGTFECLGDGGVRWSAELYDIFRLPRGLTVTADDFLALVHPDDRGRVSALIADILAPDGPDSLSVEYRALWPNGEVRWLQAKWRVPVRAGQTVCTDVCFVGAVQDITERRQAEAAALQTNAEFLHASRLSMIGEVASTIAHEVNQPMGAAANFLQVAQNLSSDETIGMLIGRARNEITRATETVRKVRQFAANRELGLKPEAVLAMLQDACSLALFGEHGENVRLTISASEQLSPALVDRTQIQQVVVNLVRNAFDALANSKCREINVAAAEIVGENMIEIVVSDSGAGVAPDLLPRLFTPFMTTKPEGMGLGLSTSRSIIEGHGGRLWVESPANGGAAFHFTIPLALPFFRPDVRQ